MRAELNLVKPYECGGGSMGSESEMGMWVFEFGLGSGSGEGMVLMGRRRLGWSVGVGYDAVVVFGVFCVFGDVVAIDGDFGLVRFVRGRGVMALMEVAAEFG